MRHQIGTADRTIATLAGRAHGVVTRQELIDAGITPAQIRQRLASGALIREHPSVYRVGHRAPAVEADYLAAVRACGEGAVLYRRSTAHLYALLEAPPPRIEVLTTGKRRPRRVMTVRTRHVDPRDVTRYHRIPTTTIQRAVVDLAGVLSPAELASAWHKALVRHRVSPDAVEDVLSRRPNSPGARELRRVIWGDVQATLSRLEQWFLELVTRAGLPPPVTNRPAGSYWVDCRWPDHRVTVELDSYRYHSSRHAWEADRRREREAYARGDELRRYTWGDVFERPEATLAELRALLAARRAA